MTTCTTTPTLPVSFGSHVVDALLRFFGRSVVTREAIDQVWLDSGLGRLDSRMLQNIGAAPELIARAEEREAWHLAATLDATRHL